jgi:hypothetical protein
VIIMEDEPAAAEPAPSAAPAPATPTAPAAAPAPAAPTPPAMKSAGEPASPAAEAATSAPERKHYERYEFLCVIFNKSNLNDLLNQASANGWEMVSMGNIDREAMCCFQRPKL